MDLLSTQLERNMARNLLLSFSQYSACLTAGCLPSDSQWRENLLNLYARISLCRTINRSLDYVACLTRLRNYGLGCQVNVLLARGDLSHRSPSVQDRASSSLSRCLTLANNFCDLIYYPAECLAWLCEGNVFGPNRSSRPFRLVSLSCWVANLFISIVGYA